MGVHLRKFITELTQSFSGLYFCKSPAVGKVVTGISYCTSWSNTAHAVFSLFLDTLESILILELFLRVITYTSQIVILKDFRVECSVFLLFSITLLMLLMPIKILCNTSFFVYLSAFLRNSHLYFQDTKVGVGKQKKTALAPHLCS